MRKIFVLLICLLICNFALGQEPTGATQRITFRSVVDLTHALDETNPAYDQASAPLFRAKTVATIEKDHYFAREICLPEHFGTHLDAPAHFASGKWTVDQIPPERLIAPLVVIDVKNHVNGNPDYQISTDDISGWEKQHGRIPETAVVIADTGWESRWHSAREYRNADSKGVMHFPGYSLAAAKLLVEQRNVYALGIDTLSIDYGPSSDYPVHQYTLSHSLYHLENVANLARVPAGSATVISAPMKLAGGSGSPVRIFALVP
ncbi:MAG TPA: cyclase family protein [Terriglobales bacterium]|nr:cyclase family protein [Terriglobales bacterium]